MKIFFVGPLKSTFAANDIEILKKSNKLSFEDAAVGRGAKGAFNLAFGAIRSIFKTIASDAVFCWFADYATFVPALAAKLLGKKIYVVAGGFDVTYIPELSCGAKTRPFRWFCAKNTFRLATKIFPVSNFAMKRLADLAGDAAKKAVVIYNGVRTDRFLDNKSSKPRKYILTVSQADDYAEYVRKGTCRFIKLAERAPEREFVVAGLRGAALELAQADARDAKNVLIIAGPLSLYEELIPLYRASSIYLQLSMEETFGVAVVEAMACGCAAIVAPGGALPELVDDEKLIARTNDEVLTAIESRFDESEEERERYRKRAKAFDLSAREKKLIDFIAGARL